MHNRAADEDPARCRPIRATPVPDAPWGRRITP